MINKARKDEILSKYNDKEEKIFVSNIIDKAQKFENTDILVYTNFLDMNELRIAENALKLLKVKYTVYGANSNMEKKNIFFIPDYLIDTINYSEYISCIKMIPKDSSTLSHKDYMGSIYNLGIKSEVIGDIFVKDEAAYVYLMQNVVDYVDLNLNKVGNQTVEVQIININENECELLKQKTEQIQIIVPSLRVDAVLSDIYNLSRNDVSEKIQKGDLFINSREIFSKNTLLMENDIVSFKRCGKIKVGQVLKKTKSENLVLVIEKYI